MIRVSHSDHIDLDGVVNEMFGEEQGARGLYARTNSGWWRIRLWRGFALAHRAKAPA